MEEEKCLKCNGSGIIYGKDGSSQTCFDCLNAGKLTSFHHKFDEEDQTNHMKCQKCNGSGIMKEKDGTNHTCWDCLTSGRLDNHNSNLKDSGIKV